MSVYAFAEIIAILRADAENGIPTDAVKLATDLHPHLPSLSLDEVVTLISCCIDSIKGAEAWLPTDNLE